MSLANKSKPDRGRHFLREWRQAHAKTQADIADYLNVEQSTISKIERGILPYNEDFLERLAALYDCSLSDLLTVNPKEPPDKPRLIYNNLRNAPPVVQERALAILSTVLKTD